MVLPQPVICFSFILPFLWTKVKCLIITLDIAGGCYYASTKKTERTIKAMMIFLLAVGLLIAGYFIYGRIVEKIFAANEKEVTPAVAKCDNVDYMVLPTWRVFLIRRDFGCVVRSGGLIVDCVRLNFCRRGA